MHLNDTNSPPSDSLYYNTHAMNQTFYGKNPQLPVNGNCGGEEKISAACRPQPGSTLAGLAGGAYLHQAAAEGGCQSGDLLFELSAASLGLAQ